MAIGLGVARGRLLADAVKASDENIQDFLRNAPVREQERTVALQKNKNALSIAEMVARFQQNEEKNIDLVHRMYTDPQAAAELFASISPDSNLTVFPGKMEGGMFTTIILTSPNGEKQEMRLEELEALIGRLGKSTNANSEEAQTRLAKRAEYAAKLTQLEEQTERALAKAKIEGANTNELAQIKHANEIKMLKFTAQAEADQRVVEKDSEAYYQEAHARLLRDHGLRFVDSEMGERSWFTFGSTESLAEEDVAPVLKQIAVEAQEVTDFKNRHNALIASGQSKEGLIRTVGDALSEMRRQREASMIFRAKQAQRNLSIGENIKDRSKLSPFSVTARAQQAQAPDEEKIEGLFPWAGRQIIEAPSPLNPFMWDEEGLNTIREEAAKQAAEPIRPFGTWADPYLFGTR